jgi:hypothetical protein
VKLIANVSKKTQAQLAQDAQIKASASAAKER